MDVFSWTSDVHLRKLSEHTCKMQDGVFNVQCMDFKILNNSKKRHKAPKKGPKCMDSVDGFFKLKLLGAVLGCSRQRPLHPHMAGYRRDELDKI